jgi:hypothetical protein
MRTREPSTADVVDARQIEHELILSSGAALQMRAERILEALGAPVVDASGRREHDGVGEACERQIHRRLILTEVQSRGKKVFTPCSRGSHRLPVRCCWGSRAAASAVETELKPGEQVTVTYVEIGEKRMIKSIVKA